MPAVSYEAAARLAPLLRSIAGRYHPDSFADPRYYPPPGDDEEQVARYFLVMVAMDHRLSRPGRSYEAALGGERYHGADLLYRLGMEMYRRDPGFFSPERLARVTARDVEAWLCAGQACPPDPEARAALLRDLGSKLLSLYGGSALRLLQESRGLLHSWDPGSPGLAERLRVFEAYNDPVEKKTMLLAKFLERRGLIEIRDPEDKRVPVDNHVTRIALRLGLIEPEPPLASRIRSGEELTPWEDIAIRTAVREAWHAAAEAAGIDDFILDDILWTMGRRICTRGQPRCHSCSSHPACSGGHCALAPLCPVARGEKPPLDEHTFYRTWWY